jgi:hypothetical protein
MLNKHLKQSFVEQSLSESVRNELIDNELVLSKLVAIAGAGDIGLENVVVSMIEQNLIQLVNSITHVYLHSAATVNFNEPFEVACNLNILWYTLYV